MPQNWIQDWIAHAQQPGVIYGGFGLLLGVGYLVWRICRTIVRIGFFLLFTAVGFGLAAAVSLGLNRQLAPLPLLMSAAVGFGFFVSAIRSKIMKVVGAATVLVVGQTLGSVWFSHKGGLKETLVNANSAHTKDSPPKKAPQRPQ